jgi:citrate lyase beta subunit
VKRRERRSCLLIPGTTESSALSALDGSADEVIVDFASVPPRDKTDFLRLAIARAIQDSTHEPLIAVRINAPSTQWFTEDIIQFVLTIWSGLDAMVVPRVGGLDDVRAAAELLDEIETEFPVAHPIALEIGLERLPSVSEIDEFVGASDRVDALVLDAATTPGQRRDVIRHASSIGVQVIAGLGSGLSVADARRSGFAGAWTPAGAAAR